MSKNDNNDAIVFLDNIHTSFRKMRFLTILAISAAVVVAVAVSLRAFSFAEESKGDKIYVLDDGSVLSAYRVDNMAQRDLEAINHVTRFHELFFNVAPNTETRRRNLSSALSLADESAYSLYNDLNEQQFFSRLLHNNATQQVNVDSVKVDMSVYPYRVRAYSSRYYIRTSSVTKYALQTSCVLSEVPRSESNPHGLLIQKFVIVSDKELETRER